MKKSYRLRRRSDFERVLAGGRVYSGRALVGFARPAGRNGSRVGIAVSRQVRGSVRRNRARRRLREVVRLSLLRPDSPLRGRGISYDVVLIGRPLALELPFEVLLSDADRLRSRLWPGS